VEPAKTPGRKTWTLKDEAFVERHLSDMISGGCPISTKCVSTTSVSVRHFLFETQSLTIKQVMDKLQGMKKLSIK
jgi:hypothetical protein